MRCASIIKLIVIAHSLKRQEANDAHQRHQSVMHRSLVCMVIEGLLDVVVRRVLVVFMMNLVVALMRFARKCLRSVNIEQREERL